jgi:hypothetical protein
MKTLESSKVPRGIIAQSAGQLFFLSDEDATRMAVELGAQYSDFVYALLKKNDLPGGSRDKLVQQACDNIANWLLRTKPTVEEWKGVAEYYLAHCQ